MRRFLLLLPVLFFGTPAGSQLGTPRSCILPGGCGDVSPVPGLAGGVGNYATLDYLRNLKSFVAPPAMSRLYFSADANTDSTTGCEGGPVLHGPNAGTCLPAGLDTNPCSAELPCLTLTKCNALDDFGGVECVFDARDAWDTAADRGADAGFSLAATANANDPDAPAAIWRGSDQTSGDPFEIDCTAAWGATAQLIGLFANLLDETGGYWAFANLWLDNCPSTGNSTLGDIFRVSGADTPGDFVVLNVYVTELVGTNNEVYTSHHTSTSGGREQSGFIGINLFCHVIDNAETQPAVCFFDLGNHDNIIIGGEMSTSFDDATVNFRGLYNQTNGAGLALLNDTVIDVTFRDLNATSAGVVQLGLQLTVNSTGAVANGGFLLNRFSGFDNIANSGPVFGGVQINVDNTVVNHYFYRNSFSQVGASTYAINYNMQATGTDNNAWHIRGACNLFDELTSGVFRNGNECAEIDVNFVDEIADEGAATDYFIVGTGYTTPALFETGSTTQSCLNNPWVFDSVAAAGDQYAGAPTIPNCRHATCNNACNVDGSWIFPNNQTIPAFVAGQTIRGFYFPAGSGVDAGR